MPDGSNDAGIMIFIILSLLTSIIFSALPLPTSFHKILISECTNCNLAKRIDLSNYIFIIIVGPYVDVFSFSQANPNPNSEMH